MAQPKRNPEIQSWLDRLAIEHYGITGKQAYDQSICIKCKQPVTQSSFKDALSWREYEISSFCQSCQDDIFNSDLEE